MKVISVNLDLALYKFLTKMQRKMKNSLVCKNSQPTDLPPHKRKLDTEWREFAVQVCSEYLV